MSKMMRAARMQEVGKPMEVDMIPAPEVRPTDVLLNDMSIFEHHRFPLERINEAIGGIDNRSGGFSNFVICP